MSLSGTLIVGQLVFTISVNTFALSTMLIEKNEFVLESCHIFTCNKAAVSLQARLKGIAV